MWELINNLIKRGADIILSLLALLVLSPIMVICAIWIKSDSKGPIIFRQDRLTKGGKVFKMLKFRSMIQNAEAQGTGLFNYEGDPRVTKCGRFLRDHSLDELPQLINILKGDMTFNSVEPMKMSLFQRIKYANEIDRRWSSTYSSNANKVGSFIDPNVYELLNTSKIKLIIDLKPALDTNTLDLRIRRDFEEFKNREFKNSLEKLLPQKIIPIIVE